MKAVRLINLLPREAAGQFRWHRRSRILSRLLVAFALFTFVVAVFGMAAWRYVAIVGDAETARLVVAQRSQELRRAGIFSQQLAAFSVDLAVVRQLREPQYDPAVLTRDIVAALPANAQILTLDITFVGGEGSAEKAMTVSMSGKAQMRADVLSFQHALEVLPFVARVAAPLENIIKPEDTTFQFILTLVPPTVPAGGSE